MKPLTKRETEVMELICLGLSNKAMAEHMNCSIKTVEKHRQAIYYKWKIDSTTALIRKALRSQLFPLEDFLNSCIGERDQTRDSTPHRQPTRKTRPLPPCGSGFQNINQKPK